MKLAFIFLEWAWVFSEGNALALLEVYADYEGVYFLAELGARNGIHVLIEVSLFQLTIQNTPAFALI